MSTMHPGQWPKSLGLTGSRTVLAPQQSLFLRYPKSGQRSYHLLFSSTSVIWDSVWPRPGIHFFHFSTCFIFCYIALDQPLFNLKLIPNLASEYEHLLVVNPCRLRISICSIIYFLIAAYYLYYNTMVHGIESKQNFAIYRNGNCYFSVFILGLKNFFRIQNGCTHMRTNLKGKKCGICNEVAVHSGNDCEKFGQ